MNAGALKSSGAGFQPVGVRQSKIDLAWTKTHRLEACATKLSERRGAYVVDMYAKFRHSVDSSQEPGDRWERG